MRTNRVPSLMLVATCIMAALAAASGPARVDEAPVPESPGFYVYDGGTLTPLAPSLPTIKEYRRQGEREGERFAGFSDDRVEWKRFGPGALLVLFDQHVAHAQAQLFRLRFEGTRTVDGREVQSGTRPLNLWLPDSPVPWLLQEHGTQAGLWIFTPCTPFEPGRYCIYFGNDLNVLRRSEIPSVFAFEIR